MYNKSAGWWQKTRNAVSNLVRLHSLEARLTNIENRVKAIGQEDEKPLLVSYPPSYSDMLRSIETTVAGIAKELEDQRARQTLVALQALGLGAIAIGFGLVTVRELEQISCGSMLLVVIGLALLVLSGAWYLLRWLLKKLKANRSWAAT